MTPCCVKLTRYVEQNEAINAVSTVGTVADTVVNTIASTVADTISNTVADTVENAVANTIPSTAANTVENTVENTTPSAVPTEKEVTASEQIVAPPKRRGRKRKHPLPETVSDKMVITGKAAAVNVTHEEPAPTQEIPIEHPTHDTIEQKQTEHEQMTNDDQSANEQLAQNQTLNEETPINEAPQAEMQNKDTQDKISNKTEAEQAMPQVIGAEEAAVAPPTETETVATAAEKATIDETPSEDLENEIGSDSAVPTRRKSRKSNKRATASPKKVAQDKPEKTTRKKIPPEVCYLCGQKFKTSILLSQHMKTHLQPSTDSPVFPCNVCGKNVSNLKLHLRHHNAEKPIYAAAMATLKLSKDETYEKIPANPVVPAVVPAALMEPMAIKPIEAIESSDTTVEEASSSTDAVFTSVPVIVANNKEFDNGITSNENYTVTESFDANTLCIVNGMQPITSASYENSSTSSTFSPLAHLPLMIEEYPIDYDEILSSQMIDENQPSQSTQPEDISVEYAVALVVQPPANLAVQQNGLESINDIREQLEEISATVGQSPTKHRTWKDGNFPCNRCKRRFSTEKRQKKHVALHDKKIDCHICGKKIAFSYKYFHMRKYHRVDKTIPSNGQSAV